MLNNCSGFYSCLDGEAFERVCPREHFFDVKSQFCRRIEEARCVRNCTSALSSFAYDRTCTKYVLCYGGEAVVRECRDGLQYNPKTDRCDFPQFVDCVDNMCTMLNHPSDIKYVSSKSACDKYYICMDGNPIARTCSKGLQFNPECNCCDFPSNVNCSVSENCNCF